MQNPRVDAFVSRARTWRGEIEKLRSILLECGLDEDIRLPTELADALRKDRRLAKAFSVLTAGRRRGYVLHFTSAKQSQARTARIEKAIPRILAGKGMNEGV